MKKILATVIAALSFMIAFPVHAQYTLIGGQGGTGYSSTISGNIGNCLKVLGASPISWTIGSCGSGGGNSFSFPFDPQSWGNSTSTTLGFLNGFLSTASSTVNAPLRLTQLASGVIAGGVDGLLYKTATGTITCAGTASCGTGSFVVGSNLTITGGAGIGTISTSTALTVGGLVYATSNGYPALVSTVATGTVSASGGITVTAGQSVVGSGLTVGCTASSAGATGCLSSTDWSTFNSKQIQIVGTWPITVTGLSNNTVGFNGLSTSSPAVVPNIPYFSGVNTFANVATSSVGCSGNIACTTFTGIATASTITLTGTIPIANGGSNNNAAIGASSTAVLSDGTKYVYQKLSPANFTVANISQWTNDSGYLTTSPFAFPFTAVAGGNATSTVIYHYGGMTSLGSTTIQFASTTALTVAGTGGLYIPNAADPSVITTGQIALNTTAASTSLRYYDGTAERNLSPLTDRTFTISTSTLTAYKGVNATSSISMGVVLHAETQVSGSCVASSTGTATIVFQHSNGNLTEYVPITTTPSLITFATNNTWVMLEKRFMLIKGSATLDSDVTCSFTYRRDAD